MKTIGLIGGMSWESTKEYYRIINQRINKILGDNNSAPIIMHSLNFEEIKKLQFEGDHGWDTLNKRMAETAQKLETAGAQAVMICTNLMHKTAGYVEKSLTVPLIHIAEETAKHIKAKGVTKVGLLGTVFTVKENFYKDILQKNGIEVYIPSETEIDVINLIIYDELCRGIFTEKSKKIMFATIDHMIDKYAIEGVVLGCTELPLIIKESKITLFDTTTIHAEAAADFVLSD
ncbi:MAG: amino acid racemase [SAR324 cluster bacterium]|nr:amino acid racemase [SAR324 cluster bacterium]